MYHYQTSEFVAFKLTQAIIFFGGLFKLLAHHFHLKETFLKLIRIAAASEEIVPRKPSIPSRGT
jgi:hypothetical protein